MSRKILDILFKLPLTTRRILGGLFIFVGVGQFLTIMVLANYHLAISYNYPNGTFFGWPSWISYLLACTSALIAILLGSYGFLLLFDKKR